MKTLLRLDASARREGSHSRALADKFQDCWTETNPDGQIRTRDLALDPLPHLDSATIAAFVTNGTGPAPGIALSDTLIAELMDADDLLISSALYNFNVASPLKAYIDHVVRFGHTFAPDGKGFRGLLSGKSACLVTARGGFSASGPDFQGPAVLAALNFLGFDRTGWISLEGTNAGDEALPDRVSKAQADVKAWFTPQSLTPAHDGIA